MPILLSFWVGISGQKTRISELLLLATKCGVIAELVRIMVPNHVNARVLMKQRHTWLSGKETQKTKKKKDLLAPQSAMDVAAQATISLHRNKHHTLDNEAMIVDLLATLKLWLWATMPSLCNQRPFRTDPSTRRAKTSQVFA